MYRKRYQRIKEMRLERGLTQKQVAQAIGISVGTYGSYERWGGFRLSHIDALANFYGISTDYILDLTDQREPHPRPQKK